MAVTYGFYNSVDHDRRYDAIQFGSIFDGIIADGVFVNILNKFAVRPGEGLQVIVDTGRAWYDHTWTLNDALLPLEIEAPSPIYDRIDTVVIDVDARQSYRENTIKIVTGTPALTPTPPELLNEVDHKQHPLTYVTVKGGATVIQASNIQNLVGTELCPYAVPIVNDMDLVVQNVYEVFRDNFPSIAVDMFYPVGATYITINDSNPQSSLGGTWEKVNEGYLMVSGVTQSTYGITLNSNNSTSIYIWRRVS